MTAIAFRPIHRPLYNAVYPVEHRLTLRRVLWNKVLKSIESAPISRTSARALCLMLICGGVFAPWDTLQALWTLATWNGYKIPMLCALLAIMLNLKHVWRWLARPRQKKLRGNAFTYRGVPVDEMADKLLEWGSFRRQEAYDGLGIPQDKHQRIAEELEAHGILGRGDNNSRVLNPISREQLIRQLRALAEQKVPPLVFDDERKEWIERESSYHRYWREKQYHQQKENASIERLERRRDRAKKSLERTKEEASVFQQIMA